MLSTTNTPTQHHPSPSFRQDHDTLKRDSEETALHLLTLLLRCADHISSNNTVSASDLLPEIFFLSTPYGSPAHRVGAYFHHALASLLVSTHLRHRLPSPPSLPPHHLHPLHTALQSYNSLAPFVKFTHFTANQAIYDVLVLTASDHVHIIDVDIMQGLQWPGFFHILSSSHNPPSVKLTGFGPDLQTLNRTGSDLTRFAGSAGLRFEFNPVHGKIGDQTGLSQLGLTRPNSVVVLHWAHHGLYDVCGSEEGFVKVLQTIKPRLVTIIEQDLTKATSFEGRFVGALHYYSALFDALGEGLCRENVERHTVEIQLFGREIRNVLRGSGRVRSWREEFDRVGLETVSLSGSPKTQAELLLGMFPWKGYSLNEENGCLRLGWKGLPLLTASAWQPKDYRGNARSSSDVIRGALLDKTVL